MSKRSISLAALAIICAAFPLFAKSDPVLRSTVRIVDGLTAPDWEARFLPPARPEQQVGPDITPVLDADLISVPPATAKRRIVPIQRPVISRRENILINKPVTPAHTTDTPIAPVTTASSNAAKKPPVPTTPPTVVPPASKIDKDDETDDDSAGKRKKERRELLREERKERNYRNRRTE